MGFDFSTPLCSELLHITHNTYQIQFTEPPASFINYSKLFLFFSVFNHDPKLSLHTCKFRFYVLLSCCWISIISPCHKAVNRFPMRKKSIHCVNIVLNDELEILYSLAYVSCVHNEKHLRSKPPSRWRWKSIWEAPNHDPPSAPLSKSSTSSTCFTISPSFECERIQYAINTRMNDKLRDISNLTGVGDEIEMPRGFL